MDLACLYLMYLEITPEEIITFEVGKRTAESTFQIKNNAKGKVLFKIKASCQKAFSISPTEGSLLSEEKALVKIIYEYSEETVDLIHKFLVVAVPFSDQLDFSKRSQEYKIIGKINKNTVEKSIHKPSADEEKTVILQQIAKLQKEIGKTQEKIEKSKTIDYLTKEELDDFDIKYLILYFIIGFLTGLMVNFSN